TYYDYWQYVMTDFLIKKIDNYVIICFCVKMRDVKASRCQSARRLQPLDSRLALRAEVQGEGVDVQVDMVFHDLLVHLLGIAADVGHDTVGMPEGEIDASVQDPVDPANQVVTQPTGGKDAPERDRQSGLGLPGLAEVGDPDQALRRAGEAVFVGDDTRGDLCLQHEIFDDVRETDIFPPLLPLITICRQVSSGPFC